MSVKNPDLYEATLVEGNSYNFAGQKFVNGIPGKKLLTADERNYLEEFAVKKRVAGEDGKIITNCRFEFKLAAEVDDDYEDDDEPIAPETAPASKPTPKKADKAPVEAKDPKAGDKLATSTTKPSAVPAKATTPTSADAASRNRDR